MKYAFLALLAGAAVALTVHPADACGGCFHPPPPTSQAASQVVGHRMAFVITPEATTLYDQIEYTGDPEDFAWVLPIKGTVDVGLSSDVLFQALEDATEVEIDIPTIDCPSNPCPNLGGTGSGTGTSVGTAVDSGTSTGTGGVNILSQAVVGPYETVQLGATDPDELNDWLSDHGYAVDASVQPIIDAYVGEGFNFLALRLAPGENVNAMRPVRVTTPGASPELPLRMVAAGAGENVALSVWILSEGRYEPENFDSFFIQSPDLTWDFASNSSDYAQIAQAQFDSHPEGIWQVVAARPIFRTEIANPVLISASSTPWASGYGAENGEGALEDAQADLEVLLGDIDPDSVYLTRISSLLPRSALDEDLVLQASEDQGYLEQLLFPLEHKNVPECPTFTCPGDGGAGGAGASDAGGADGAPLGDSDGCTYSASSPWRTGAISLLLLGAVALCARRFRA